MLCQNVRQQSRKLMAISVLTKLENVEVVAVNLSKLFLRFISQLKHPCD